MDEAKELRIGSRATQQVVCGSCEKIIPAGEQFSYKDKAGNDVYFCAECKEKINEALESETKNPHVPGAILGGILAGVIAGSIWYAVVIATNVEIGYLAIGVGYLVGKGVHFGSKKKRGTLLQIISVLITLVTLLVSEFFVVSHVLANYLLESSELGAQEAAKHIYSFLIQNPNLYFESIISPIGLLIWAIGLYMAYQVNQPHRI